MCLPAPCSLLPASVQYNLKHVTRYDYSDAVSVCHNQLHLAPRTCLGQTVTEFRLTVDPQPANASERLDFFGNQVNYFALHTAHKQMTVTSESVVQVHRVAVDPQQPAEPWESIAASLKKASDPTRLEALQLSLASRRVATAPTTSDAFRKFAAASFPPGASLLASSRDLTRRIYKEFEFDSRATNVNTPPDEFLNLGRGVCQDFAHLAIACLRSFGLAARYVSGYLRTEPPPGKPRLAGADASHAWFSVWCGELGWVDFDPTNDMVVAGDHITVAWGRDYDDVCPISGVFLGGGSHTVNVAVDVIPQPVAVAQAQMQQQQ